MAGPMDEAALKGLVAREISLARDARVERAGRHEKALGYYRGEMGKYVPAEAGRSSAVSRDLADTVGWMLPGIMKVFTASEHMAVAEPVGKEDVAFAADATDAINHVFWKENDGYRTVYNAIWDSLVTGNGIVKTWFDSTPEYRVSFHGGLSAEEYTLLVEGDDVEVLAHSERQEEVVDPASGAAGPIFVHDVKIRRAVRAGRTRCEAIPPEDFGIDGAATTTADARFIYHRDEKTRSELIAMGFERGLVMSLGTAGSDGAERLARGERADPGGAGEGDPSMEPVDYYECYLRADIDGDGVAELVKVDYAGNAGGGEILDWAEWEDEHPFDDIPCNPMPHAWEASSIADETMDVQEIKTVLLRQGLDNTYATNNPQRFVKGRILNPDQLFSPSFGGAIFGDANAEVTNLAVPFVAQHVYEAIAYQDQVIERRTGVSRATKALDPDALQNQTATAVQAARDAAYSQIELVARNQAELGWKKVFRKILKLEIRHQDKPRDIRMRGRFMAVDPRHWNAEMDVSVNVGLGTGSRDRDMALLQMVLGNQVSLTDRLARGGFADKALEMLPYILTTLAKTAEAAGIRSPEIFYPQVSGDDIAAGKERIAQRAAGGDPKAGIERERLALEAQKRAADIGNDRARAEHDFRLAAERQEREFALKERQMEREFALKEWQLGQELALKERLTAAQMGLRAAGAGMQGAGGSEGPATSRVEMGGDPG